MLVTHYLLKLGRSCSDSSLVQASAFLCIELCGSSSFNPLNAPLVFLLDFLQDVLYELLSERVVAEFRK